MIGFAEIFFLLIVFAGLYVWHKVDSWEIDDMSDTELGKQTLRSLSGNGQLSPVKDPEAKKVFHALISGLNKSPDQFHLHMIDLQEINAFAVPGGHVILTRGFLERLLDETFTPGHLAGVLAHELGHIQLGHARKRLKRQNMMDRAKQGLDLVGKGKTGTLTHLGKFLLSHKLSRDYEFEADQFATDLLFDSPYQASSLAEFLEKIDNQSRDFPAWLSLLSTHPPTQIRSEKILNRINQLRASAQAQ